MESLNEVYKSTYTKCLDSRNSETIENYKEEIMEDVKNVDLTTPKSLIGHVKLVAANTALLDLLHSSVFNTKNET